MRNRISSGAPLGVTLGCLWGLVLAAPGQAQEAPFNSTLLSNFDQNGQSYADIWAAGNFAYLAHFGSNKVDILDISNPASPSLASTILVPSPNNSASAQDVKVGDNLLFIALESGGSDGVVIYDVTDPFSPSLLTRVDPEPGNYEFIHNVFYDNGWLYMSNSSDNTVAIVDLRTFDPNTAPPSITTWDYRLQNVASTFVHDITVVSGYLYCSGWDAMYVYDVSNLGAQAPQLVGTVDGISSHAVWGSQGATWVVTTEEREGGAVRLYETSISGNNFTLLPRDSWVPTKNSAFSAHNVTIDGDRVYVSCYQKGALVFEIEPASKTWELVASYDTSTSSPSGFAGNWGIYPYNGADEVILSDLSNGMYIIDFSALEFDYTALPRTYDPALGASIDVTISGLGNAVLNSGSPTLFTRIDNGSFVGTPMGLSGGTWSAALPNAAGGQRVDYYVQAADSGGKTWRDPINAPTDFHTTYATGGLTQVFQDDFALDQGWSVTGSASSGQWVRVNPNATGAAPEDDDPDGSDTFCYVTDNGPVGGSDSSDDLDGGPVTLTSPLLDFSTGDGLVSWTRWFFNDDADVADELLVQISNDAGASWTTVETIELLAGGWLRHTARVSDFVTPSAQVQVRFQADDNPNNSLTEAGVDSFLAEVFDDSTGGGGTDATVTSRNGSGTNPNVFSTVTLPIIGTNWDTAIDTAAAGVNGGLTFVLSYQGGLSGLPTAFGELLIDSTSPLVGFTTSFVVGGSSTHSSAVPADTSLVGFAFSAQSFLNQTGILTNALDALIGDQ